MPFPKNVILFALIVNVIACRKDKSNDPPKDQLESVVGTYLCTYKGREVVGDSGWDISGTKALFVTTFTAPNSLSISAMIGGTATLQSDWTFGNMRSYGHFANDSLYLFTYATPAAMSQTLFVGVKF